jgi:hypothetical protein
VICFCFSQIRSSAIYETCLTKSDFFFPALCGILHDSRRESVLECGGLDSRCLIGQGRIPGVSAVLPNAKWSSSHKD